MGVFGRFSNRIVSLLSVVSQFCGIGLDCVYGAIPHHKKAEIFPPENLAGRRRTKRRYWAQRFHSQIKRGANGPLLTGARLARVEQQCSPCHLTVLCIGAKLTWNMEKEFT